VPARSFVLIIVFVFVIAFGALTIDSVVQQGLGGATVIALVVLALIVVGGLGALRQPPRE
jgi:hypothetical protein